MLVVCLPVYLSVSRVSGTRELHTTTTINYETDDKVKATDKKERRMEKEEGGKKNIGNPSRPCPLFPSVDRIGHEWVCARKIR